MNFKKRLFNKYGYDYPIFISELGWTGLSEGYIRSALSRMVKAGEIARFSRGIYFFQRETVFGGKSILYIPLIFRRKYICENGVVNGFYSGLNLENLLGLSTQVPATTEITTNIVPKSRRQKVGWYRVLLKKPRVPINSGNVALLQFLNVIERLELTSFRKNDYDILAQFIRKKSLKKETVLKTIRYYPKQTLTNLNKTGLIYELA